MHLRLRKCEKLPQTCGFAEHFLQFYEIGCKFAVLSSAFKTVIILTELLHYCATKRHHNGNSAHMKVNYALYVICAKQMNFCGTADDLARNTG